VRRYIPNDGLPDSVSAPWWVQRLPRTIRCHLLYHPLRIWSPSIAAIRGKIACPLCGLIYEK